MNFVKDLNESGVDVWIRQVVVPGVHDKTKILLPIFRRVIYNACGKYCKIHPCTYQKQFENLPRYEQINIC